MAAIRDLHDVLVRGEKLLIRLPDNVARLAQLDRKLAQYEDRMAVQLSKIQEEDGTLLATDLEDALRKHTIFYQYHLLKGVLERKMLVYSLFEAELCFPRAHRDADERALVREKFRKAWRIVKDRVETGGRNVR